MGHANGQATGVSGARFGRAAAAGLLLAGCAPAAGPPGGGLSSVPPAAAPTASAMPASTPPPEPSSLATSASPSGAPTSEPAGGFSRTDFSGGSDAAGSAAVAVRLDAHDGYDRFVIEFAGAVPAYAVTRRPDAVFTRSPEGGTVQLGGTAGVLVRLHPVSDWTSYRAATALHPGLPRVREARLLENFEAVQQWGLGVAGSPALRVFTLGSPSRLVIDVSTD